MAARPIAASTISFGLVSLPVKLYATAVSKSRIAFNMVHKTCGTRVKQQYICPKDDVIVPREDIVKGYEFAKGQYVLFSEEELKAVEQPKTDSIEITEFVPADQVDRLYFDRAYYLGPDKGGARAYRLLAAALAQTDRVAIAKHATRGKQHLVMVRPYEGGLLLEQLRYAEEVRAFSDVELEEGEVSDSELESRRPARRPSIVRRVPGHRLHGRRARAYARPHPAKGRRRRHRHNGPRGASDSDHRPDGSPQGQPLGRGLGTEAGKSRLQQEKEGARP